MSRRFLTILASITVLSATVFIEPASGASSRAYQKLPSSGVVLKKKSGYYIQCYYSGLGEICEYVYARVRTSKGASTKLQRVKIKNGPLKRKFGYYVQCYYSGLGEVCEYVYARPKR